MSGCPFASRRGFLAASGGLLAAAGVGRTARAQQADATAVQAEPFWGAHQAGIATPQQHSTYFAALDLTAKKPADIVALLRSWTAAAARMTNGEPAAVLGDNLSVPAGDSGDVLGLPPSRLTITFGFGPGLFNKDGRDRYGLAGRRPDALAELPKFIGDQLVEGRTGGDLSIQACADDPQVAFHAVRQLVRQAYGVAELRWTQAGFIAGYGAGTTPRNLMGFKDGTINPTALDDFVWVGGDAPDWLRGGSYLVTRRIRISLEHWDRTEVDFQEEVVGRHKYSGAPLGGKHEFDPMDLAAVDNEGNPVIAENAHVRLAAPAMNDGAQILRRAYSYDDGTNFTAERWPPWRQGLQYDAGLFFIAYQSDPRIGFIKIFENMAKLDALNQYTTHVGSALFACPRGPRQGEYIGQSLFEAA
jgi:deferrochelatase/peroxidase EfeB